MLSQTALPSATSTPSRLAAALACNRIPGLDAMRLMAVFLVLGYHGGINPPDWPPLINGNLGVEAFFVLSGFLITRLLLAEQAQTGTVGLMGFYRRRFARLMPVFYVYVIACVVITQIRHKELPWGAVWSAVTYVINYYQGLTGGQTHVLSHCWSLAVEEQFYLLWPLLLRWFMRLSPTAAWRGTWALIVLVWAGRAVAQYWSLAPDPYLYRALETRADQLLAGCLLAMALERPAAVAFFDRLAALRWPLLVLVVLLFWSGTHDGDFDYRYMFGFAVEPVLVALILPLLIDLAARPGGFAAAGLNARVVVALGQASYGIYLFHQLIFHPMRSALAKGMGEYASFFAAFLLLGWIAHVSYTRFEQPVRARLR